MIELEDIRGRTFAWLRRHREPLDCRLYEGSVVAGSITRERPKAPYEVTFAGVTWNIWHRSGWGRVREQIGFSDGRLIFAESVARFDMNHRSFNTVTFDDGAVYSMEQQDRQLAAWTDASRDRPIEFLKFGQPSAGEGIVSSRAEIAHAPMLLVIGILRAIEGRAFIVPQH